MLNHYFDYRKSGGTLSKTKFANAFFRENNADGGVAGLLGERTGYFKGALADTKKGKAMSPGTTASGEFKGGNNNTINNPPPIQTNNSPETITFDDYTGKKMNFLDRINRNKFLDYVKNQGSYEMGEDEEADALYDAYRLATGRDKFMQDVTVDSCLLYTSPSPRDGLLSRMPSSA